MRTYYHKFQQICHWLYSWMVKVVGLHSYIFPSLKLTFPHLKMDDWNTILSYWGGLFSAMLVSGRVYTYAKNRGVSKNWGTPKWMVYNGKSY